MIFRNWWWSSRPREDLQELVKIFRNQWRSSGTSEDLQELVRIFRNQWRSSGTGEDLQEPVKIFRNWWRSSETGEDLKEVFRCWGGLGASRRLRGFEGVKGAGYSLETIVVKLVWDILWSFEVYQIFKQMLTDRQTDRRTDREIFAILKLLSELKRKF